MFNLNRNAKSMYRYILMLIATAPYMAAGSADADTGSAGDVPKIVVSLAGMDMSTPKGAEMVYGRIVTAAKIVCRVDQSRELERIQRARACFRNAVDDAVGQANRPQLSALHAQRMGGQGEMIQSARR